MDFQIFPLKGVGLIKFDMSPYEVRAIIGSEYKTFKRTSQSSFPCDFFQSDGIFCYYDSSGLLEAVEFSGPARPKIGDVDILGAAFGKAVSLLSGLDDQTVLESDGAIAYQLGISIFASLAKDDPSAPIESLLAFRSGYYN
ncbi:hypothetical protein GCM10010873_16160 [Cypionkella aquatica]|uniref:Uncharacterized protein n=1 Tax=Cypionkella aquatica TaxID=1756042 RepID=A0AA37WZR7_9RHOB|nr:hypothetical protein [Cypionkella aquatica]GLS86642.1 hypothetical protein GCM10010873_16160 [Cypionkella aquatica]